MKATFRGGRIGSAAHNDRSYPGGERTEEVRILVRDGRRVRKLGPAERLEDLERQFYGQRYKTSVEAQNERHVRSRHPERCKTTDDLYKGRRTKPLEIVLQIGNKDNAPDLGALTGAINGFMSSLTATYHNCQPLSISLHNDETTPHIHLRVVFDHQGEDGPVICQTAALQEMGVPLPDPEKPESRYNCRLMVWTEQCRELWIAHCREQGLKIDDPQKCNREHLSIRNYKAAAATSDRERARTLDRDIER